MALALILLSLFHALAVAAAFLMGWAAHVGWMGIELHLYVAIGSVALALFTHSMVLFYFIGTGKTLKEVLQRFEVQGDYPRRIRWFKMQTSGPLTLAAAALIVTSWLGGRTLFGGSSSPHFWVGAATVLLNFWTVAREVRSIALNVAIFHELGEKLGELEPEEAGTGQPA